MEDLLHEFLIETNESLDTVDRQLVRLESEPTNADVLANIFRLVHTIKGTCGFIGLPRLEKLAHAAETLMSRFRSGAAVTPEAVSLILHAVDKIKEILAALEAEQREPEGSDGSLIERLEKMAAGQTVPPRQTVESMPLPSEAQPRDAASRDNAPELNDASSRSTLRVNVETLERLMTITSELVLTRNQLLEVSRQGNEADIKNSLQRLSLVTSELQDGVMQTRMQPIGNAWQKLPRIVRDLATELGKEIELQMFGGETELDRQVLELIRDPLTHLVRNAADHGLERTAERVSKGKLARGLIRISARHEGGHILIELADDGRGLNTERILAKAIASELVTPSAAQRMTENQIHDLIFTAGFSTRSGATNISGRGIGLDVVRTNVDQIGGSVEVKSVPAAGVCFTLKIPLTLAIVQALIVGAGGQRYAIPELAVIELLRARSGVKKGIDKITGQPLIRLRGKLLPFVHLSALASEPEDPAEIDKGYVVVVQTGGRRFGIVVDNVFQAEEIVVKPLASLLRPTRAFSGNTIMGDGSVILIVDPSGLSEVLSLGSAAVAYADDIIPTAEAPPFTALLLFRAGGAGQKAVPLASITRIEEVDNAKIEPADGRELFRFNERLIPVVRYPGSEHKRAERYPVLVFSEGNRAVALVVDEILDVVNEPLAVEILGEKPGVIGTAMVRGRATEIVDVAGFLPAGLRPAAVSPSDLRVLLVDDAPFFRNMLPPVLEVAGFRVVSAASVSEAQAALEATSFDVIVSDLEMPGTDGFAFAQALRDNPRYAAIPLIALSSHATPALLDQIHDAGFASFVPKFDRPGLIAAIRSVATNLHKAA